MSDVGQNHHSDTSKSSSTKSPKITADAKIVDSVERENSARSVAIGDDLAGMQNEKWSRVSPLAIFYFFAKTIYVLLNSVLIYSLPAIAASYSTIKEHPIYIAFAVAALLGIILLLSVGKYWFYYYKFTKDRVEIKQGIFKKSHLDLPFSKIQNVKIVQPIYYRFNEYSYIELDTAGSSQQEAKIVALPLTLAESFKQMILQIKDDKPSTLDYNNQAEKSDSGNSSQEILLNRRSLVDLIIHGISNNRVWILLGFLAPFYNSISENIGTILESLGLDIVSYLDYESQSMGLFLLHVLSVVMLIMLVIVSFSVIGSIFVFYNYSLSRLGERYIRRSGLLTKHEVSMRLSRIQVAVQQQDWLDIIIGRTNLRFEQNTSLPAGGAQAGNINNASKLVVPSVTPEESAALIQDSFAVKPFYDIDFVKISKRYLVRALIFPVLPIIVLINTLVFIGNELTMLNLSALMAFNLALLCLLYLRWWRWGYYFSEGFVYIRKGLFGVNYYVFPVGKTQQITFTQSVFMKRRKLADVKYVLASGAQKVPLIPEAIAQEQVDKALLLLARDKPAWM